MPDSYYNTPVMGLTAQRQFDQIESEPVPLLPGQFETPFTLVRTNRHGFTIATRHYSQSSVDYAMAEEL